VTEAGASVVPTPIGNIEPAALCRVRFDDPGTIALLFESEGEAAAVLPDVTCRYFRGPFMLDDVVTADKGWRLSFVVESWKKQADSMFVSLARNRMTMLNGAAIRLHINRHRPPLAALFNPGMMLRIEASRPQSVFGPLRLDLLGRRLQ
jgi:hypothetical protein